jgi:hypothetical protein
MHQSPVSPPILMTVRGIYLSVIPGLEEDNVGCVVDEAVVLKEGCLIHNYSWPLMELRSQKSWVESGPIWSKEQKEKCGLDPNGN